MCRTAYDAMDTDVLDQGNKSVSLHSQTDSPPFSPKKDIFYFARPSVHFTHLLELLDFKRPASTVQVSMFLHLPIQSMMQPAYNFLFPLRSVPYRTKSLQMTIGLWW